MSKKKHNRRDFMKSLGIVGGVIRHGSPAASLLAGIISGAQSKALAQATGAVSPRKYLSIVQPQAPARTVFDSFFTPYENLNHTYNPGTGTRYIANGGRYTSVGYETVLRHGIQVPYMWKYDVPRSSGGGRPMSDLLANLLSIQGITTKNAGHGGSRALHFLPLGASQSLGAMSADYSDAALGTVSFASSNYKHKSLKSKPANVLRLFNGNYLQALLKPFLSGLNSSDQASKDALMTSRELVKNSIANLADILNPNASASISSSKLAFELSQGAFSDIDTFWADRVPVYEDLINRVVHSVDRYEGFDDLPIGSVDTAGRSTQYNFNTNGNIVRTADLRSMILGGTQISFMAERFAVAEYLLTKNLSDSVTIPLNSLQGMMNIGGQNYHQLDEHFTGIMVSTMLNFYLFRSISACMLELIDRLKAHSVFDETVIELSGEFNRDARIDGSGSDHGWKGKSVSYFSGAFKNGPLVMGVLKNSTGNTAGVWGEGAVDPILGKQLELHDMAATLAHLLRVPNPFNFAAPIVTLNESGELNPITSKTKIIV